MSEYDRYNITGLIESLTLIRDRFGDITFPTHCEHDELTLAGFDPDDLTQDDQSFLKARGFTIDGESVTSSWFGSA